MRANEAVHAMMPGACIECGCTDATPCVDPATGQACYWADEDRTVCSACAIAEVDDGPLVVSATEGECAQYIRELRAAGSAGR